MKKLSKFISAFIATFIRERIIWYRPVVLIATANDYDEAFLAHLEQERRSIKKALRWANLRSRFNKLVLLQNATSKDVLRALERYQGRIVIFQYSGHAHSNTLQLEDGQLALENIARKLESENNLQLVVLNGCYSDSAEAQQLYANHSCDLITTNDRIQDTLASQFTRLLFENLSKGCDGETAFEQCKQQLVDDYQRDIFFRDLEDIDEGHSDNNTDNSSAPNWAWQFYKGNVPNLDDVKGAQDSKNYNWRLKRLVWLPIVLSFCLCFSSSVFAWQWFSYQDKREQSDRGIVLSRMIPSSAGGWRLVKDRLRAALNSDLDVQAYDYHVSISDRHFGLEKNTLEDQSLQKNCKSLGVGIDTLATFANKHNSDLVIFFKTLKETTENITVQPFLYGTTKSAAAEYLTGCQAFAGEFEIELPITEEAVGSLIKHQLRPRIEALAHFLDAVRKYEEPTLQAFDVSEETGLQTGLQTIVDSLKESIWSETVLLNNADAADVHGKEILYYFVAGYLTNHVQYKGSVQVLCPVKYGKPILEAYSLPALKCAEELLRRVRMINPSYERERLGEANIVLARGIHLAREGSDDDSNDGCSYIGRAFNNYMLLSSSLTEPLNQLQAKYAAANASYQLLEKSCIDTLPQSLVALLIDNLTTISESFKTGTVEGLSLESALRADIQKGLWQLVDIFEVEETHHASVLAAQQSFKQAWELTKALDNSQASQSTRKDISAFQGIAHMALAKLEAESEEHIDLAKGYFVKSLATSRGPVRLIRSVDLDSQVSKCLENIEKIMNNDTLSQNNQSDVSCVNFN